MMLSLDLNFLSLNRLQSCGNFLCCFGSCDRTSVPRYLLSTVEELQIEERYNNIFTTFNWAFTEQFKRRKKIFLNAFFLNSNMENIKLHR